MTQPINPYLFEKGTTLYTVMNKFKLDAINIKLTKLNICKTLSSHFKSSRHFNKYIYYLLFALIINIFLWSCLSLKK